MKAALYKGPNNIVVDDIEIPEPGNGELQVKVHSTGICGTDLHLYQGYRIGPWKIDKDRVFGHEFGGVITKIGKNVPDSFKTGNRVVVEPNIGCGQCKTCLAGAYVQCEKGQSIIGIHRNGGFAEYTVAPHEKVFNIPAEFSFRAASVFEPFAICVYGLVRAPVIAGDTVAVLGPGVAGHHFTMLARASGASKIILAGPNQARLDLGKKIGADILINTRKKDLVKEVMQKTGGRGVDYVFEAAGAQGSLESMGKIVANKGTINIYSVPVKPADNIDFAEYLFKDITLVTSSGAQNSFERGIKIVASGIVDIEKVITHTFPLEDIEEAFKVVEKRLDGVGKAVVMVDPGLK